MVERQLPKLHTRVRFPSPAPVFQQWTDTVGSRAAMLAREVSDTQRCVSLQCRRDAQGIGEYEAAGIAKNFKSKNLNQ
jgi:hypothetical protein